MTLDFRNNTIVITGTLQEWDRETATDFAEELGLRVVGAVSRNVDYLVVGSKPGKTKLDKAAELGVPIITEDDWMKAVDAELGEKGEIQ